MGGPPAQGSLVAGKFSADGQFYRARVESATADGGARVTFVDFGNSETLPPTSLRRLSAELGADNVALEGSGLVVTLDRPGRSADVIALLVGAGLRVTTASRRGGLEDAFLQLTGAEA